MKKRKIPVAVILICALFLSRGCVYGIAELMYYNSQRMNLTQNGIFEYNSEDLYFELCVFDENWYGVIRCDGVYGGEEFNVLIEGDGLMGCGSQIYPLSYENGEMVKGECIGYVSLYYKKKDHRIKVEELTFDIPKDGDPDEVRIDDFYLEAVELYD